MGAGIALDFTVRYPERVGQLILIGVASPLRPLADRSGFDARLKLIQSGATAEEIVAKTFDFTKNAFSPYMASENPRAIEKVRQEHLGNDPRSYAERLLALQNPPSSASQLADVKCPTLILVGDADVRTPVQMSEDLDKAIRHSYLKIIPNCGHFYGYEQPEFASQIMINWLQAFSRARPTLSPASIATG